ncbi:unnamed protein product [Lymnaea stagnalis]|uniref:Uncharacterized protein n=1 Tax=Lymnaea stagnalis TaxID=6523 RepID=A0AAV2H7T3_LYMST
MFTIPAIHHAASRNDDSPLGGMHLNAINGSSDALGSNPLGGSYLNQPRAYGGLFGVSLSENHPYRPQDSGMSFYESSNTWQTSTTQSSDAPVASTRAPQTSSACYHTTARQREALECLRNSVKMSPEVPRRRSLDLDHSSSNNRYYCEDLLLSLEDLPPISDARRGRTVYEKELHSDFDMATLSLNEVDISTSDPHYPETDQTNCDSGSTLALQQKRRRRYHTTDSATAERAIKLLEKIKESRRETNNNNNSQKHSRPRDLQDTTEHTTAASNSSSSVRHTVQRHLSETAQQRDKPTNSTRRSKDRKLLTRASVD